MVRDLEVAIVKATSHEDELAGEKYIREILQLTSYSQGYVHTCVSTVSKRLGKTRDWIVALKALMLVHRLVNDGITLNPITSLYYVAPCCLAFLLVPWIYVEYPTLRDTSSFHFDYVIFGTNSFYAFALNLAVFLLVGKTSALTMNVAGVVKDWLLIAFSWSVIKDTVTPINLVGYGKTLEIAVIKYLTSYRR
ncbi:putative ANTH domain-containing protein [Rosa chinensis]|uniref:Putative ANTH domain-containing protein n=1 Tax=Rosa chinensis TaxID=74649 RepID=A0A2P6QHG7_ROSCH|nr:putative ANTH domain-containing protein [Rosa chinensis]